MSSLPKQHSPAPSSTPTKQSGFRATPAAPSQPRPIGRSSANPRQDGEYTQPEYFDPLLPNEKSAPKGQVDLEEGGGEGEREGEEGRTAAENASQPPSTTFKPFFTLVDESNSSDYYHPTVHYIFSDDDPELLTEASIRVLETGQLSPIPAQTTQHSAGGGSIEDTTASSESQNQHRQHSSNLGRPSLLPPPIPGVKDRFILLDIEPTPTTIAPTAPSSGPDAAALAGTSAGTTGTAMISTSPSQKQQQQQQQPASDQATTAATPFGYRIVSAHSLTPDWQVLDASFGPAPTFDTPQQPQNAAEANLGDNTLMLRIQGTAGFPRDIPVGKDRDRDATKEKQTLEEMMEQFDKRMTELTRIIERNGDYSPALAAGPAVFPGVHDEDEEKDQGEDDTREREVSNEIRAEVALGPEETL